MELCSLKCWNIYEYVNLVGKERNCNISEAYSYLNNWTITKAQNWEKFAGGGGKDEAKRISILQQYARRGP